MAHVSALLNIEDAVTRYLFKYKKPLEDFDIYLEHTCDLYQRFREHDSNQVVSELVTINALGIITMPSAMIDFCDLCYSLNGEWVSFTEMDRIVNVTTDVGFGDDILHSDDIGYGSRGGINDYNYTFDWEARRIICEGIVSTDVLLRYVSSGIETTGITTIPIMIVPMIDAYLLWKESYWIKGLERERLMREKDFTKAELEVRNLINAMSFEQWKDLLLGLSSQAPIR